MNLDGMEISRRRAQLTTFPDVAVWKFEWPPRFVCRAKALTDEQKEIVPKSDAFFERLVDEVWVGG